MKIYEIAMFIFILNMVLNLMNVLNATIYSESGQYLFTGVETSKIPGEKIMDITTAEQKISVTVGEQQNWLVATVTSFIETVRLTMQGIGAFIGLFLNSTLFSYNTYYKFLCYGGVDCSISSFMWTFASILSGVTYLIYSAALIEFATGRDVE